MNTCPMCLDNEESMGHLLFNYRFARMMWNELLDELGCSQVRPCYISELFHAWISPMQSPKGKQMWKILFFAIIWLLWKEGNARCFEGLQSSIDSVMEKIKFIVAYWVSDQSFLS